MIKRFIKIQLLVLVCFLSALSVHAQDKSYIDNHRVMAKLLGERYGIPAQVILAIAAIESSGGEGATARVLNNHFGMVGDNDYVNKRGHSSRYKQYANVFSSYLDFCQLMTRKHFYKKLKGNMDAKAWVTAISHAGYSEVPAEWTKKVMGVLNTISGPFITILPSPVLASVK